MAGTLVANTINTDTGLFSTNNAYLGVAKAWVNFQGGQGNTAGTINGSFNVSSITVNGAGYFTINFTTAMANANYSAVGSCMYYSTYNAAGHDWVSITSYTTSSFVLLTCNANNSSENVAVVSAIVLGS